MTTWIKNPRLRTTVEGLIVFNVAGSLIVFILDMAGLLDATLRSHIIHVLMVIDVILIVTSIPSLRRQRPQ